MGQLVLCIVGGVNEQNNIVQNVLVYDWIAKRAIIASNVYNSNSKNFQCHFTQDILVQIESRSLSSWFNIF